MILYEIQSNIIITRRWWYHHPQAHGDHNIVHRDYNLPAHINYTKAYKVWAKLGFSEKEERY